MNQTINNLELVCPICGSTYIKGKWTANTNHTRYLETRIAELTEKIDNLLKEQENAQTSESSDQNRTNDDYWE